MKPNAAVQTLLRCDESGEPFRIAGSCFRLWSPNHFITANHCVSECREINIKVMNVLDDYNDLECEQIHRHPTSDIAIIKIKDKVPNEFEKFKLAKYEFNYGTAVHCFGVVCDKNGSHKNATFRAVGGIVQRDLIYSDGKYKSTALELSTPIPIGMSGGPAFLAASPDLAIGVSIASVSTEVVVKGYEEYKDEKMHLKERISEITQYGIILLLNPLKAWLEEIMGRES